MRNFRDRVVILKSINYSEADKILIVFGKEFGKFSLLAKGMRKLTSKNRGNMQTLSIADISFYKGQGMPLLLETKAVVIPDFTILDIDNTRRVLHLVSRLTGEEQPYPKVFDALVSAIKGGLDDERTNRFRVLLLIEEGLIHDMRQCSICGKSIDLDFFQLSSFVLICKNCYSSKKWPSSDIIGTAHNLYSNSKFVKAMDSYIDNLLLELV